MTKSISFDGLHTLEYTDTGKTHIYKIDGVRCPGATTVGAMYPKGKGLERWLVAQGIEAYDKQTKLKAAGAIGRVVHKYAEAHMTGTNFDWGLVDGADDSNIIRDCIQQYDALVATFPDDKLYAAEALVASPSLMVASQIDLVLIRDGKVLIRDYKTGKKIYISALHQTVLYRRMCREWLNIQCDTLEIFKFSKDPGTIPVETCLVTNDGMTLNDTWLPYEGLLDELEAQTVRNIQTYRHTNGPEKLLSNYYKEK